MMIPLAEWFAVELAGQVVVVGAEPVDAEDRRGHFCEVLREVPAVVGAVIGSTLDR